MLLLATLLAVGHEFSLLHGTALALLLHENVSCSEQADPVIEADRQLDF